MTDHSSLLLSMQQTIQKRYGDRAKNFMIPPPVFETFQGRFIDYDPITSSLTAQFPVLEKYLNPFGILQGGVTSALVDNTIGPLSFLVAPYNVTRRLEMKFIQKITLETGNINIICNLDHRKGPRLFFKAGVYSPNGEILARAKSIHWILENEDIHA
jgi:acyl-coenzyme A thioesterase PaaI-like protein